MSNDSNAFSQAWATAAKLSPVSRRDLLRGAAVAAGAAAVLAGTVLPAEAKMAQKAAGYQETPAKDGSNCASCALFQAPSSCTLVDGTISPSGWCRFYAKKS
jgi:secreted PhoX family phosphatase